MLYSTIAYFVELYSENTISKDFVWLYRALDSAESIGALSRTILSHTHFWIWLVFCLTIFWFILGKGKSHNFSTVIRTLRHFNFFAYFTRMYCTYSIAILNTKCKAKKERMILTNGHQGWYKIKIRTPKNHSKTLKWWYDDDAR